MSDKTSKVTMLTCPACGGQYKGQRGLTAHQKSCPKKRAEEVLALATQLSERKAEARPAREAPPITHEVWDENIATAKRPTAETYPYRITGTVDPATGNFVYSVWPPVEKKVLNCIEGAFKVVRVGAAGVAPAPIRIYEKYVWDPPASPRDPRDMRRGRSPTFKGITVRVE